MLRESIEKRRDRTRKFKGNCIIQANWAIPYPVVFSSLDDNSSRQYFQKLTRNTTERLLKSEVTEISHSNQQSRVITSLWGRDTNWNNITVGFFLFPSVFLSASREVIGTPPDAAVTWDCPVQVLPLPHLPLFLQCQRNSLLKSCSMG